jgi:hypothetical protein
MPVFILFVAAIFGLAAINGTVGTMFTQATKDMFGDGQKKGCLVWVAAVLVIAAAMKTIDLPGAGKAFIVLLIIVFLLSGSNKGLLGQLETDIQGIGTPAAAPAKGAGK